MNSTKPNLLVICGRNKRRSRTAESIFKNEQRFNIKSAGLSPKSNVQINEQLLLWADLLLVMEDGQAARISGQYRHLNLPQMETLHIEDRYEYLDPELIDLLKERINNTLKFRYKM